MSGKIESTRAELETVFRQKYGDPATANWGPRLRYGFGYFNPDDFYESLIAELVTPNSDWIDVGGGRDLFPSNANLAKLLSERCRSLVGVDPSDNIEHNPFVHERAKCFLEDYKADRLFDLATMRMVVEHVANPQAFVSALARLLRPGGLAVVYTVNRWSPVTCVSHAVPFWLHNPIKKVLWGSDEKDTFPVVYKMNTRKDLRKLFEAAGFSERSFSKLDDCRTFSRWPLLSRMELSSWSLLHRMGLHYPENCVMGVYERG